MICTCLAPRHGKQCMARALLSSYSWRGHTHHHDRTTEQRGENNGGAGAQHRVTHAPRQSHRRRRQQRLPHGRQPRSEQQLAHRLPTPRWGVLPQTARRRRIPHGAGATPAAPPCRGLQPARCATATQLRCRHRQLVGRHRDAHSHCAGPPRATGTDSRHMHRVRAGTRQQLARESSKRTSRLVPP